MTRPAPNAEWLQARIARITGEEGPIDPDEDLTLYGLDSMSVMRLVMQLEEQGVVVEFDELLQKPTLNAWQNLIERREPQRKNKRLQPDRMIRQKSSGYT